MRLLILSDIHGNLDALDACMAAAPSCDAVANLGDTVGYGACPNEVVEKMREVGEIFVRGNHDRACSGLTDLSDFNPVAGLAAQWTRDALTDDNRAWVRNLPRGPITDAKWDRVQFVHGSPYDEDEYLMTLPAVAGALNGTPFELTLFGHTHMQAVYSKNGREFNEFEIDCGLRHRVGTDSIDLEPGSRYLVNPGSVGQPRDGDPRAAFAVYDSELKRLTFYRIPYDVAKAQQRILAAGLPPRLAARLADGH